MPIDSIQVLTLAGGLLLVLLAALLLRVWRQSKDVGLGLYGLGICLFPLVLLAFWLGREPSLPWLLLARVVGAASLAVGFVGLSCFLRNDRHVRVADMLVVGGVAAAVLATNVLAQSTLQYWSGQFAITAIMVICAVYAVQASRREPEHGHLLVAVALLTHPALLTGFVLKGWPPVWLSLMDCVPLTLVGMALLAVSATRLRVSVQRELEQRHAAELEVRELNSRLQARVQELDQASQCLRIAVNGAGIRVWEANITSRTVTFVRLLDSGGARTKSFSLDEVLENCPPEDRKQLRALWAKVEDGWVKSGSTEFKTLSPETGEVRYWHAHFEALHSGSGDKVFVGATQDVTDALTAREALQARRREERANKAKSELMSVLGHELRTPLNAILGFAKLMVYREKANPGQESFSRNILDAGEHLLHLIDSVSQLSRLEAGALTVSYEPVFVREVVDEVFEQLRGQAETAKVRLSQDGRERSPWVVRADRAKLTQVLTHLVSNGIKYNRPSGMVRVSLQKSAKMCQIHVADSGLGMSAVQQERLFKPFERLGREALGIEGHGLGLAISRQLAEAMQGTLTCQSEENSGTVFTLALPVSAERPSSEGSATPLSAAPAASSTHQGRVLYIEDNSVNIELMREMLMARPHVEFLSAKTGDEAVRVLREKQPDILLVDLLLGLERGEEVLSTIRRWGYTGPAIAVSANALAEDRARALRDGFDAFWAKPVDVHNALAELDARLAEIHGQPAVSTATSAS